MLARHSGTGLFGVTSLSSMRLQEALDRLSSVVDHMIDGIVTFDDGGSIESANPAAQAMFGYAANELVGQSVKILMPVLNKMPRESVAAHLFADGGRREIEGRRKDDTTFPIELAVSEFRHEGGRYFTAIVRDITERKRGEERTRFLAPRRLCCRALSTQPVSWGGLHRFPCHSLLTGAWSISLAKAVNSNRSQPLTGTSSKRTSCDGSRGLALALDDRVRSLQKLCGSSGPSGGCEP